MGKRVVVTGADGFIGKNLVQALKRRDDVDIVPVDVSTPEQKLLDLCVKSDVLFHLAGANRPPDPAEFQKVNADLTSRILERLEQAENRPIIVFSSSTQATEDNPYGRSKLNAERTLRHFADRTKADVRIFRLPNVFGKWSRPNYNSVVATFCHQAANGESLTVNDPATALTLIYVDDVVRLFLNVIDGQDSPSNDGLCLAQPVHDTTVGDLARIVLGFPALQSGGALPDFANPLEKYLYSTYLSFVTGSGLAYAAEKKSDDRGYLFEMVKSAHCGQIFVSRTVPGITRGNHYHDTKVEKFCVVEGSATIALRHLVTDEITTFEVRGEDCKVVDIAPGYTHAITNTGSTELVTIFWANEIFDPDQPDTYYEQV